MGYLRVLEGVGVMTKQMKEIVQKEYLRRDEQVTRSML